MHAQGKDKARTRQGEGNYNRSHTDNVKAHVLPGKRKRMVFRALCIGTIEYDAGNELFFEGLYGIHDLVTFEGESGKELQPAYAIEYKNELAAHRSHVSG